GGALVALILSGGADFSYYPALTPLTWSPRDAALTLLLVTLAGSSVFMEVKETVLWHYLRSGI
ncbi:MAG TPA: hypothetical protein DDY70_05120, partial [Clostridiales bacterium]|nr:hypothetical protein [Clostridiales bacterium]